MSLADKVIHKLQQQGLDCVYPDGYYNLETQIRNAVQESEVETSSTFAYRMDEMINRFVAEIHVCNKSWWHNSEGVRIDRNKGELIALQHSELSECLEGERTGKMDDHLPHRKAAEVELADAVIRIFDYAGGFGYDLGGAIVEKLAYNAQRADHKHSERAKKGGKKF